MSKSAGHDLRASDPAREERLARAVAAGRERRARNRERMQERERQLEPPSAPWLAGVKTFLCAALFLPLGIPLYSLCELVREVFGETAGWIAGAASVALLSAIVYRGPHLVRACASDFRGVFRGWRSDPVTFWMVLFVLVGVPVIAILGFANFEHL